MITFAIIEKFGINHILPFKDTIEQRTLFTAWTGLLRKIHLMFEEESSNIDESGLLMGKMMNDKTLKYTTTLIFFFPIHYAGIYHCLRRYSYIPSGKKNKKIITMKMTFSAFVINGLISGAAIFESTQNSGKFLIGTMFLCFGFIVGKPHIAGTRQIINHYLPDGPIPVYKEDEYG
jgi:hypothetical protein